MLAIYRRHNPKRCSSTDSQNCSNRRHPCPIWVRGSRADGRYVRVPLKSRDWTKALEVMREMEVTGERPATVAAPQERITIEKWRDQFVKNATNGKYQLGNDPKIRNAVSAAHCVCTRTRASVSRMNWISSPCRNSEIRGRISRYRNRRNRNASEASSNSRSRVNGSRKTLRRSSGKLKPRGRNSFPSRRTR